jgi:hypothetical protein
VLTPGKTPSLKVERVSRVTVVSKRVEHEPSLPSFGDAKPELDYYIDKKLVKT